MTAPAVYIDIGDAYATDPYPQAMWDGTTWDAEGSRWAGILPHWTEMSCRVRGVEIERGRGGLLDIFGPGRCQVDIDNADGWATWSPNSPGPVTAGSWVRVRADEVVLFTGTVRRIVDTYSPGSRPGAQLVITDPLARLATARIPEGPPVGAGDTAAARIARVLDAIGHPPQLRALDPGGPLLTATRYGAPAVDLCQQAAVAAGGALYADRRGVVTYRGPSWLRVAPRSAAAVARVTNTPTAEPPTYAANLATIPNQADIEAGTTAGWVPAGAPSLAADVTTSAEGRYSLRIYNFAPGAAAGAQWGLVANLPAVVPGRYYSAVVSYLAAAGVSARLRLQWVDAAGAQLPTVEEVIEVSPGTWREQWVRGYAPAAAVKARIQWSHVPGAGRPEGTEYRVDRAGIFTGNVSTWVPPNYVPPAPGAPQVCATGMAPNGPDVDRVVNDVTVTGVDDATDPATTREAHQWDPDSQARWGVQSWGVGQLPTIARTQLDALAGRALSMGRTPRPHIDTIELSPIADPAAGPVVRDIDLGDRLAVDYADPNGWGWAFDTHVHGVRHKITPAGADNLAREWSCQLTLDDASALVPGVAWDFAAWDADQWSTA